MKKILLFTILFNLATIISFGQNIHQTIDTIWFKDVLNSWTNQKKANQLVFEFYNKYSNNQLNLNPAFDTLCYLNLTSANLDGDNTIEHIIMLGRDDSIATIIIVKRIKWKWEIIYKSDFRYPNVQILSGGKPNKTILIKFLFCDETKTDSNKIIIYENNKIIYKFLKLKEKGISDINIPEHIRYMSPNNKTTLFLISPYFDENDNQIACTYFYKYFLNKYYRYKLPFDVNEEEYTTPFFDGINTIYLNWDEEKQTFYLGDQDAIIHCFLNPDNETNFFEVFKDEIEATSNYGNQFQKKICKYFIRK